MKPIASFVNELLRGRETGPMVAHHEVIPPLSARYLDPPPGLDPRITAGLAALGVNRFYTHQAQAIAAVRAGRDVVIVTPTASGRVQFAKRPLTNASEPVARFCHPPAGFSPSATASCQLNAPVPAAVPRTAIRPKARLSVGGAVRLHAGHPGT